MNDNTTLRPFESYLDEVAREEGFQDYGYMSVVLTDDCLADQLIKHTTEANRRMLEDAFKSQKDTQAAYHQLFGFGIGYTCEINDLLSGLGMTKKEWDDIKSNGGVTTLLERHLEEI